METENHKKPLTKPVAPRFSTITAPTSSSAARSAPGNALNKPPARPTISRKIPSTPSTLRHKKHTSTSSADVKTSEDENTTNGINAKPKRRSLGPSITNERSVPSKPSSRASTISPTVRRPPATSSLRKPLISSTRGLTDTKNRLSTIPASPAVNGKKDVQTKSAEEDARQLELDQLRDSHTTLLEQADARHQDLDDLREKYTASIGLADSRQVELDQLRDTHATLIEQADRHQQELEDLRKKHTASTEQAEDHQVELGQLHDTRTSLLKQAEAGQQELGDLRAICAASVELAEARQVDLSQLQVTYATLVEQAEAHQQEINNLRGKHTASVDLSNAQRLELDKLHDAHATVLKHSDTGAAEHAAVVESLRADHESAAQDHALIAKRLQDEIFALQQSKADEANATSAVYDAKAKGHILEISRLQDEIIALNHSHTDKAAITAEKHALEMKDLRHEIKDLEKGKANTVAANLASHQTAAQEHSLEAKRLEAEIAALNQSNAEEVAITRSRHESTVREHVANVKRLEAEIAQSLWKIDTANTALTSHEMKTQEQAKLIERLQDEIIVLKKSNTDEAANTSVRLDATTQQHQLQVRSLQEEITLSHSKTDEAKAARETASQEHILEVERLQDEIKDSWSKSAKLVAAVASHESITREHVLVVERLQDEVIALNQSKSDVALATQIKIDEARLTADAHQEQNRVLEAQLLSMKSDLQAARFQTDSLKQVLRSVEGKSNEKDQEQAVEVEQLKKDLSGAVMRLADMSARTMEIETRHQTALEAVQDASGQYQEEGKMVEAELVKYRARCLQLEEEVESLKTQQVPQPDRNEPSHYDYDGLDHMDPQPMKLWKSEERAKEQEAALKVENVGHDKPVNPPAIPPGKKHIVDTQLATLQEGLKQIDEINQEFLEEHEQMARMLSKVPVE